MSDLIIRDDIKECIDSAKLDIALSIIVLSSQMDDLDPDEILKTAHSFIDITQFTEDEMYYALDEIEVACYSIVAYVQDLYEKGTIKRDDMGFVLPKNQLQKFREDFE